MDFFLLLYHSFWEKPDAMLQEHLANGGSHRVSFWGLLMTMWVTLEADPLAPVELQMSVDPGDSLSAMSWENLSQNNSAKPLLDSRLIETVR